MMFIFNIVFDYKEAYFHYDIQHTKIFKEENKSFSTRYKQSNYFRNGDFHTAPIRYTCLYLTFSCKILVYIFLYMQLKL